MSKPDQWVNVLLAIIIVMHISILIIGIVIHKLPVLIPLLNIAVALWVIIYWIQKQLRMQEYFIDMQEMTMLATEVVVIITGVYFIGTAHRDQWLKVMQYIVFGIHLVLLLLLLVFMFTFKIKRLI